MNTDLLRGLSLDTINEAIKQTQGYFARHSQTGEFIVAKNVSGLGDASYLAIAPISSELLGACETPESIISLITNQLTELESRALGKLGKSH